MIRTTVPAKSYMNLLIRQWECCGYRWQLLVGERYQSRLDWCPTCPACGSTRMRVVVCGGRHYKKRGTIFKVLDNLHAKKPITMIIEGGAGGADTIAGEWADDNDIDHLRCPAKWEEYGKRAGPVRNSHMLTFEPELVVAFPGGKGTRNMILFAGQKCIKVIKPEG